MFVPQETLLRRTDCIPPQILELYRNTPTDFFCETVNPKDTINKNHRRAASEIIRFFIENQREDKGRIVFLSGAMASGKGATEWLVGKAFPHQAFKHRIDWKRAGTDITNSNGDSSLKMPARLFDRVEEILAWAVPGKLLVIDEFEFAKNSQREIGEFLRELQRRGINSLIGALNLDFGRKQWLTTAPLLDMADRAIVLAASCTEQGCGAPSWFTQRTINGEPAHEDDPVILVGSVQDCYSTKCERDHKVLPPRNGRKMFF